MKVKEGADGPWRFTTTEPLVFVLSQPPTRLFENDWLHVSNTGLLVISAGYSWDGCSKSPDGPRGYDGLPVTWRASLIHDALYQFCIDNGVYTRAQADQFFKEALQEAGFAFWPVYYAAVRLFGGVFHAMGREADQKQPEGV